MSEDEKAAQIQDAIREYVKSKENLAHIGKRLEDFRAAAMIAYNLTAPGALHTQRGKTAAEWKHLLTGAELAGLLDKYFSTLDRIANLGEYLKSVGYGSLVS